jgi:23S rRNA pseudouridine2605 synthase
MSERLNKVLAQHGIGSRREVERWITEGRLELNGKQVKLGDRYEEGDRVSLDGRDVTKRLLSNAPAQVLAYHKPQGQLIERSNVASDDNFEDVDSGETVMDRLPKQRGVRWVPINPMHAGDSGLLLLTNDGKLSYALTRQKKNIPTVYMVRVHVRGGVSSAPQLSTRMLMDNDVIEFTSVEASGGEGDNVWYKVTMPRADRRAAVRALFASNGLTVSRMMQVAFGGIELTKDLPRSRHQLLKPAQVERLYEVAQLKVERNSINSDEKVRNSAKTDPVKGSDTKVKLKRVITDAARSKRRVSTLKSRSSRD